MNITLSKEIIKRSNMRNKYLKSRIGEDRQSFAKQRNVCVFLLRKTKKSYYLILNQNMSDNRKFWKTVKPQINWSAMKKPHWSKIKRLLLMTRRQQKFYMVFSLNFENVRDPTLKAILKYRNKPSIMAIKKL